MWILEQWNLKDEEKKNSKNNHYSSNIVNKMSKAIFQEHNRYSRNQWSTFYLISYSTVLKYIIDSELNNHQLFWILRQQDFPKQ